MARAHGAEHLLVHDALTGTVVQPAILALGTAVMVIIGVSGRDADSFNREDRSRGIRSSRLSEVPCQVQVSLANTRLFKKNVRGTR